MRHSIHEAFFSKKRRAPFLDFLSFFFFPLCFLIFALAFVRIFLDYEIFLPIVCFFFDEKRLSCYE